MNAPNAPSLLATVELAPRDPIMGVTEAFNADPNPRKVNLGVGVYCDDTGKVPLLECVRHAEREMTDKASPRSYLPIDGIPAYDREVRALLFGADADVISAGRAVTVQALGGTGALKVGADFLRRFAPSAQVWISDPSWENHRALFEGAGFTVNIYPYYDAPTRGLDFAGMRATLETLPAGSIVLLHACCHNPTGVDPTPAQWGEVATIVRARGLVPFVDLAYQGFGDGLDTDGAIVRKFAATPGPLLVSSSFSKSFSLYGERVGALSVVAGDKDEAGRVLVAVEAPHTRQLFQSADARRPDRDHRAVFTGTARIMGSRARVDARPHQTYARDPSRKPPRAGARCRFPLHADATRHVLVLGPDQGAGAGARRGILRLRDRHRPDLRRVAQLAQCRGRRRRDCKRNSLSPPPRRRFDSITVYAIIPGCPTRE